MASIFLVDDHLLVRESVGTALAEFGHSVVGGHHGVGDVVEAVRLAAPDVVILDIHLQEESGLRLLSGLQRHVPDAAVVVLTMSSTKRDLDEALKGGAKGYVLKGAPMADLRCAVEAAARGQPYLCSQAAAMAAGQLAAKTDEEMIESLSFRERQVIRMVANGWSSAEIGRRLFLSPKTVESYRSRIMAKIGATHLAALIRFAIRNGLIDADD